MAWYVSIIATLLFLCANLVTYAPHVHQLGDIDWCVSGIATLVSIAIARSLSRLPPDHWIERSKVAWAVLIAAAIGSRLLLALIL